MAKGLCTETEQWPGPRRIVSFREILLHAAEREKTVCDRLFLERIDDDSRREMAIVPEMRSRPFSGSIRFVGRCAEDDHWVESPRKQHPWKYSVRSTRLEALLESAAQHALRQRFHRFPKKGRLFYIGANFQLV